MSERDSLNVKLINQHATSQACLTNHRKMIYNATPTYLDIYRCIVCITN